MDDSKFSVVIFIGFCAVCAIAGCIATWIAMTGPQECYVEIEYSDHTAVHITECKL